MRLDRLLANSGLGTRSQVRAMIMHGKVKVNGTVVNDSSMHVNEDDPVEVDGQQINCQTKLYFLFDKPDGVLTAMEDKRLPCIADYIPAELKSKKLAPVGRLDYHTSGLLIITNDGELSHRLQSPRYEVPKIYLAVFRGTDWTEEEINTIRSGFNIRDKGYDEKIAIFAFFDKEVVELRRIGLAGVTVREESDGCGSIRPLTEEELRMLFEATGMA